MSRAIPQPRTAFFGRRRSLAGVRSRLIRHRLVTLTGVGGAGKTRLALRVAEDAVPELADDVAWVEFASLRDSRLLASTACSHLDVPVSTGVSPLEALCERLRSSRLLLVLDNCEHLTEACADLVSKLLERCPDLRVLATSRESLGLEGEELSPVPPLRVPEAGSRGELRVESAMQAPAVQLFVDRAGAARPGFELTSENVDSVVQLCVRLEGIPLALELAAARVRVLTVDQITDRLDESLALLGRSGQRGTSRHRTMRAALDWSHDLLTEPEKALFRRLGAFGGPADIVACEAVCAGGVLERSDILDALTGLVDKSLVVVDERERRAWYRLLEPVRQFAVECLQGSEDHDAVRRRHAGYYLEVARMAARELRGPGRPEALAALESVHENLRCAWDHAVDSGDADTVAGFARALFWFWHFAGYVREGRARVEEALETLAPEGAVRNELQYAAASLAWMQGDYKPAGERLEACVADCRDDGRHELLAITLRELAGVRFAQEDLRKATQLYEEAVGHLRATGTGWDLALALLMMADVRESLGDSGPSRELREEARSLFAETKDPWGQSLAQFSIGVAVARAGDLDDARSYAHEALALQRSLGDYWSLGQVLALLGEIELGAGHAERSVEFLLQGLEAFRKVGDRTSMVHLLLTLAEAERRRGRVLRAVRLAGAGHVHAECLEGVYPYSISTDEDRAQSLDALRRKAGGTTFAEEWAAGRSLQLEQAVTFALDVGAAERIEEAGRKEGGAPDLRVFTLGPSVIYRGERRLHAADWTYALPRELLFYLLVHGPRTKEQIGLDLWPDASTDELRGRFRTTLHQLRRTLGDNAWVLYREGRYEFNRELDYWFDVEAFELGLDRGEALEDRDPRRAADELERGIDLYRGDFLEGERTADWASDHRERLRRRFNQFLLALGGLRAADGAYEAAAALYRRAVAQDNLNERAHLALARCLALGGHRSAALRQLDGLSELLRVELDADPSAEVRELRARLERNLEP